MTIEEFNAKYKGEFRLVEEDPESRYYRKYHYKLFWVFPKAEKLGAAFLTIEEAVDYIEWLRKQEEAAEGINW